MRLLVAAALLLAATPAAAQPARGLTGAYDRDNPFARILRREPGAAASIVHEDAQVLVFMPLSMTAPGHVLVIPKRLGARTLLDMTPSEMTACLIAARKAARAQVAALAATGFRIIQNNGVTSSQHVYHPHFHVIPSFDPAVPPRPSDPPNTRAELDAMAAKLRAAWPKD